MASEPLGVLARARRWALETPGEASLSAAALLATLWVVARPFAVVHHPPIADLPYHAAQTAIVRHYLDPSWHFREQFTLHPFEVPYLSMYALGAAFCWVLPIAWATKLMTIVLLLLLPAGLAVLCWGMKKTPLWGVAALSLTWSTLTHWGFLNFLGALGLFAMSVGFTLRLLDAPSRGRQAALAASLAGIFVTHVYRFPFAVLAVLVTAAVMYPATRRVRPLVLPLAVPVGFFLLWTLLREEALAPTLRLSKPDWSRLGELGLHVFGGFEPPEGAPQNPVSLREHLLVRQLLLLLGATALLATGFFFAQGRARSRTAAELRWGIGVTVLPLLLASGLLSAYLMLPMQLGEWWFVYPREATSAAYLLLATLPDLPRQLHHRAPLLALCVAGSLRLSGLVTAEWRKFDSLTADFRAIVAKIQPAPKLYHIIYERRGTALRVSPFMHLPAWVQAEKGGWLGFHPVVWHHSPIRYRQGSPAVPPPLPERFEWTPQHFRVLEHGAFFDTFLVRHSIDPSKVFHDDRSIRLVTHIGTWWLYRRAPAATGPSGTPP